MRHRPSDCFRRPLFLGPCLLLVLMLGACSSGEKMAPEKLIVTGSSTVAPLVSEIAKRFEAEHPEVRIDVQAGGSSRGLADVRQGLADIGMVSRSAKADENDVQWHALARDGLAILVHADNPASSITEDQVKAIYREEVENWQQLGAHDAPITVVSKAEGRSTLEVFLAHFELTSAEIEADVIIGDNQQGIKTVVGNPDAIAYVSIGTAEFEVSQGTPIKILDLGQVRASTEAVRSGDYPIARTLHLITLDNDADEPESWRRRFLDFCRSPAVADLVEGQFFVPLAR